ncbi:MAG: Uma2 family endonuclease [Cytophagales bacterium]|nr:Uma2 family endonuclease [Cytophagales bacterium]
METVETLEAVEEISAYEAERGKPLPSKNHSRIQSNITGLLWNQYRKEYDILTELSLEFNGKTYVPDICVFPPMTYDTMRDEVRVTQPPLTIVEILSPRQSADEVVAKFEIYFNQGVKSCWFIIPATDSIFIFTPGRKIQVFHDEPLTDPATGISIDLREIFV